MELLTKLFPKNNKLFAWTKIIFFCLFAGLTIWKFSHQIDPDFWWHLKVGEWIVQHRALMRVDVFSFTLQGYQWVDHEWLLNIFFYLTYTFGGMYVLAVFFTTAFFIPFTWFLKKSQTWFELIATGFFWNI